jgi:WD40 repeat protein
MLLALTFSPYGRTLASADEGTVKLWSAETGQEMLSLPQGGSVNRIAFSGDGRILAAGTFSRTQNRINLIRAPSFDVIAAVEAKEKVEVKKP